MAGSCRNPQHEPMAQANYHAACLDYRKMVREMLDTEDKGFNNWEIEFLDDMWKRTTYTEKQMRKIDEIYEAKM